MKIDELESIIKKQESIGSTIAILVMSKPLTYKLKGYKMRTPFGLAEVYNCTEHNDRRDFVVRCELSGLKKVLKQLKQYKSSTEQKEG